MDGVVFSSESEDLERARAILDQLPRPPEIQTITLKPAYDADGVPALKLSFQVAPGVGYDDEIVKRLSRFLDNATDAILQSGVSRFPYASLDEAA